MNKQISVLGNKIWTKDFVLILLASLLGNIAMNMHGSTLSLLVLHLGGSKSSIGLVTGIISLSALLCRPLAGSLLDNRGRRIILVAGLLIISLTSLSYNLASSIAILIFLRLVLGVGGSAFGTSVGTIITDITSKRDLDKTFGYNALVGTIATAVGSYLGIYMIQKLNYNIFFTTIFVVSMLGVVVSALINYEKKGKVKSSLRKYSKSKDFTLDSIVEKTAIPYCVANLFIFFAFPGVFAFMPAYAASIGISGIGSFFIVYSLAFIAGRFISGVMARYWNMNKLIAAGMILMALSYWVFSISNTITMIFIGGILYGIGSSTAQPGLNSLAVSNCTPDRRGVANSTYFISVDMGYLIGSFSWGILAQVMGYKVTYLISGIFILISLSIFFYNSRRAKVEEEKNLRMSA